MSCLEVPIPQKLNSNSQQFKVNNDQPGSETHEHLKLPVFADVSGCAVDGTHEMAEMTHPHLPVLILGHLTLFRILKVDQRFFCGIEMGGFRKICNILRYNLCN